MESKSALSWMLLSAWVLSAASTVSVTITAAPGQTVSLPCRAPSNTHIIVVEWTRPGLEPEYVLMYKDGWSDPYHQHQAFKGRVELQDKEMKDGDVSMILKNVTSNDTGTYECRVVLGKTNGLRRRKKRANLPTEPISTIYLAVKFTEVHSGDTEEGGDKETGDKDGRDKERGDKKGGNEDQRIGLGVSLSTFLVFIVVFIIYKCCKKSQRYHQIQSE